MNNIAQYLDSTNLHISATRDEIKKLIKDAIGSKVAGVCICPEWSMFVKQKLQGTGIKTIIVPNWKAGGGLARLSGVAESSMKEADEVDYIIDTYFFYELKDWDKCEKELKWVKEQTNGVLKVIIETNYVRKTHPDEYKKLIKQAVKFVEKAGATFVKTDSGLFPRKDFDTLIEDVKFIKKCTRLSIKAAGGIQNIQQCKQLIDLGVERIGTSRADQIIKEEENEISVK